MTRKQKWEEKQLDGYFKLQTSEISHEKTWTWLRKASIKRKNESLLIAAQNNALRTYYVKTKIDKTKQNSKCCLCGDRDGATNHIISECSTLEQKEYKTRHDWVGKVIHWELCKKFKFDHMNKWYMHNPESPLENEIETFPEFWDTNGAPEQVIANTKKKKEKKRRKEKRTCRIVISREAKST